jgi:predicted heme/steroid binding protein
MSASSSPPASDDQAGGSDPTRIFTPEELARHDGSQPGLPMLIAYQGQLYDGTGLFMWMTGSHFWLAAGCGLTGCRDEAPHGAEMLQRARHVGHLVPQGQPIG